MTGHIFISHSNRDDALVDVLRKLLRGHDLIPWTDDEKIRVGDNVNKAIDLAVSQASAFVVVLSNHAIRSRWVLHEMKVAKAALARNPKYPIIPLIFSDDDIMLIETHLGENLRGVVISDEANGIEKAMPHILTPLGKHLASAEKGGAELAPARPLNELSLELRHPRFEEKQGVRRAVANGVLRWEPGPGGEIAVSKEFLFRAPIANLELEDLRWYLESYYMWPAGVFKDRAAKVEAELPVWGEALYKQAAPLQETHKVIQAWRGGMGERRFTVFLHPDPLPGGSADKVETQEAGTVLLGLPWELLHDGKFFLFKGGKGARVRRRLPNQEKRERILARPPIRILLVSPRPEDEQTTYIDHRVSARPLVEAIEPLGGLVDLHLLTPATLPNLRKALNRAADADKPFHVVHFDGHGVYSKRSGLGELCFEAPSDVAKLDQRAAALVPANEMAAIMHEHRVPMVFLEACQSAQHAKDPTGSVAAALLDEGVASVVAMSHSVLVETARRFVKVFYEELASGARVGKAMLAGQLELEDDPIRGHIFGAGDLELQDWFVPVLFQEQDDPQLFKELTSDENRILEGKRRKHDMGFLPEEPQHGFVGRSRVLLRLERLLEAEPYGVIVGRGGEGKTTLAVELTRWLVRTGRFDRCAFVCVEQADDGRKALDVIGRQLVNNFSVAEYGQDLDKALLPLEKALREERVLVVVDNMETLLQPPEGSARREAWESEPLAGVYELCRRLGAAHPHTRLLFTSREDLGAPFGRERCAMRPGPLGVDEGIELLSAALKEAGLEPNAQDPGEREDLVGLVRATGGHARSLSLLARHVSRLGVRATTADFARLMKGLHTQHGDDCELSLFASVALSLERVPERLRAKLGVLGLFEGSVNLFNMLLLGFEMEEAQEIQKALMEVGLAEAGPWGHIRLHPGLCPYLYGQLPDEVRAEAHSRWLETMAAYVGFLYQNLSKDAQMSQNLTVLELPNLLTLLDGLEAAGDAERTAATASSLEALVRPLGRPRALAQISRIHQQAASALGQGWSHRVFEAKRQRIEGLLSEGRVSEAFEAAEKLLALCKQHGEETYEGADYDLAMANISLGRVLERGGASQRALPYLREAQKRFGALGEQGNESAARMASTCFAEMGGCFLDIGQLDESEAAYKEMIKRSEKLQAHRDVAVSKGQLGTVYLYQKKYGEALAAHEEARAQFEALGEPLVVAGSWHQTGRVYSEMDQFEPAEAAYRKSMEIRIQHKDLSGEADSLGELGNLHLNIGRLKEAAAFYLKAADIRVRIGDLAREGLDRSNLGDTLIKLKRFDEAREALNRAVVCKERFGHASEPWKTWDILCDLEKAVGNKAAEREAWEKAIALYDAYRRNGGENHNPGGRLCFGFLGALQQGQTEGLSEQLTEIIEDEEWFPEMRLLAHALKKILSGERDPSLAEDHEHPYTHVVELRLVLEAVS